MKKKRRIDSVKKGAILTYLFPFFIIGGLISCSITSNLPEGEKLYIGRGRIIIKDEDNTKQGGVALAQAEDCLNVAPNGAIFGSPIVRFPYPLGLLLYNSFVKDSTYIGKLLFKLSSSPILLSSVKTDIRAIIAKNKLKEYGYFNAFVTDSIVCQGKDSLLAKVYYSVSMGSPYFYDSISFLPPKILKSEVPFDHKKNSFLKKGQQFSFNKIIEDRNNIVHFLRDNGYYYFKPNMLNYEIDTIASSGKVRMRVKLKKNLEKKALQVWNIGKVIFSVNGNATDEMQDTLNWGGLIVRSNGSIPIRKGVLLDRIFIKEKEFYSEEKERFTQKALSRLGAFSYTKFTYVPRKDSISKILDLYIDSRLDKPWNISFETLFRNKSNGLLGPMIDLTLTRSNAFHGGEKFAFSLLGSYEWQSLKSIFQRGDLFNSFQYGGEISFLTPSLLLPFFNTKDYTFRSNSQIKLAGSVLHRAKYFRMTTFAFSLSYSVLSQERHKHYFSPFRLKYSFLSHQTEIFKRIVAENKGLELSLQSQFIPEIAYTYTFDHNYKNRGDHNLWMEYSISEAGNLINSIYAISGKAFNKTKKLVNVPFAQFVRLTGEGRYTYSMTPSQTLAFRLGLGAIFSYGNMRVAPYSEQFYVGGANSIRSYIVRSVGPGAYVPDSKHFSFIDQVGDLKLEANLEWRFRLLGNLHGALFLDTGNVWLLHKDPTRLNGSIEEIKTAKEFFEQVAVGTGLGVRYDFGPVILRMDLGIGIHLPYKTYREGYYNIPSFREGLNYHLAVGYPF